VALSFEDGSLKLESTLDTASAEPIVEDTETGAHWTVFVQDGQVGWESTGTVQDDDVTLQDTVTAQHYRLRVSDGNLNWLAVSVGGDIFFRALQRGFAEGSLIGVR
jgi:hypothetical protein